MKKVATLALGIMATLAIHSGIVVQAQSDDLIKASPSTLPEITHVMNVAAVLPTTEAAINQFTNDWSITDTKVNAIKAKQEAGEKLTVYEKDWLTAQNKHFYEDIFKNRLLRRAEFYKRAHNWNGDNKKAREYSDVTLAPQVNSYGYDVLDAMNKELIEVVKNSANSNHAGLAKQMVAIIEKHQSHIVNEELRSYVNETVRYAAAQSVKDKAADLPAEPASEHKVDLLKAIQNNK